MKLADTEISAERSSVTRELLVNFLRTKSLESPSHILHSFPYNTNRQATFVHSASKSPLQCTFLET